LLFFEFFYFILFFVIFGYFDLLVLKINFLKKYFKIFSSKKHFEKQHLSQFQIDPKLS